MIKREIQFCTGHEVENNLPNDNFVMVRGYLNRDMNYLSHNEELEFEESTYVM